MRETHSNVVLPGIPRIHEKLVEDAITLRGKEMDYNIIEEVSKAVLGDEIGEMTALEYADFLKDLREKGEQLDKVREVAGDSYNLLEKCHWIATHTPEDFDTFWRQARFLEDINELWRKWKEDEINYMGFFIQELGKIMEDKQYLPIRHLHRKVRKK